MKLISNKVAEKDIREWLSDHGYAGHAAKFGEIELHAIQPPGWLQVFRFDAEVKRLHDSKTVKLWGALRDDERYHHLEIEVFESFAHRAGCLNRWSDGLITNKERNFGRPQFDWLVFVPALALLVLILLTAVALKVFG